MNRIVLLGQLADHPEKRYTPDGVPVTRFVLVVGEDPIRVFTRRHLAELAGELKKGELLAVEGRVAMRTYQSRDGHKRRMAEVEASQLHQIQGNQVVSLNEHHDSTAPVRERIHKEIDHGRS